MAKPLTEERKEAIVAPLVRMINNSQGESPVELAELCRFIVGANLYSGSAFSNEEIARRAASDVVVLEIVSVALRRGGVLG